MPDEKPSRSNAVYQAAWEAKDFAGCVNALIKQITPDTGKSEISASKHFADLVNAEITQARELDVLPSGFPPFNEEIVTRWLEEKRMRSEDRKFLPFIDRVLATQMPERAKTRGNSYQSRHGFARDSDDYKGLYSHFSPDAYKDAFAAHAEHCIREFGSDKAGSNSKRFADYLTLAMDELHIAPEELALRTGIYPSFIKAFTEGKLVPEGEALARIRREINAPGHEGQDRIMNNLLAGDRKRFAKRPMKEYNLITALGEVTRETHLHEFIDNAFDSKFHSQNGLQYKKVEPKGSGRDTFIASQLRQKSVDSAKTGHYADFRTRADSRENIAAFAKGIAKAVRDDSGFYEQLISEFALRKAQKKPFVEIFDAYLKTGNTDFKGLFDKTAAEWNCNIKEVCEALNIPAKGLQHKDLDDAYAPQLLRKLADEQDFSLQQKHDLVALRAGTLGMGSVQELTQSAQAILNADKPTYGEFADNPVAAAVRAMPSQAEKKPGEAIDKTRVPNALLALLLKRCDSYLNSYLPAIGKSAGNRPPTDLLKGDAPFLIIRHDNGTPTIYQPETAKPAAAYFTDDKATQEALALAFLEIGKKSTPDELMQKLDKKEIAPGEIALQLRLQNFQTRGELMKQLTGNGAYTSAVSQFEAGGKPLSQELAEQFADYAYRNQPGTACKEHFATALCGKAVGKEAEDQWKLRLAGIEAAIEFGHEKFAKDGAKNFPALLDQIVELTAGGVAIDFINRLDPSPSRSTYFGWQNGKAFTPEHAGALAGLLVEEGMRKELEPKLIKLATQHIPVYDASVLENISVKSSAGERSAALRQMRENQKLLIGDVAERAGINRDTYAACEEAGYLPSIRFAKQRENNVRKIAAIAGAFVPEDAENSIGQRTRLAQILGTAPPEVAADKAKGIV